MLAGTTTPRPPAPAIDRPGPRIADPAAAGGTYAAKGAVPAAGALGPRVDDAGQTLGVPFAEILP